MPRPPGSERLLPGGTGLAVVRSYRRCAGRTGQTGQTRPAKSGAKLATVWTRTPTLGLAASMYLPSPV